MKSKGAAEMKKGQTLTTAKVATRQTSHFTEKTVTAVLPFATHLLWREFQKHL